MGIVGKVMKQMDRKSCTLALTVVSAFSLCKLHMVAAQVPPQGKQSDEFQFTKGIQQGPLVAQNGSTVLGLPAIQGA